MKKITSILLAIAILATLALTGCDNTNEKLTPEQQITKIKSIYTGAYNAYFVNKNTAMAAFSVPATTGGLNDYLQENGEEVVGSANKAAYDTMYAWYTITAQTIIELKGVDTLSKKYVITEDTNLVDKVSEKFAGITPNEDFDPIVYTELITSIEICGLKDNAVFTRVVINEIPCNFVVYYNNASDYGFTLWRNVEKEMVQYENKGASKYFYIAEFVNTTDSGYYYSDSVKTITLHQGDESQLISEAEGIINGFGAYFDDTVKTFTEKTETVLIFD